MMKRRRIKGFSLKMDFLQFEDKKQKPLDIAFYETSNSINKSKT
jgi:hypothetical protein